MHWVASTPPAASASPAGVDALQERAAKAIDRTEAMLRMMTLGLSLHEIEEQLDWLDAKARLAGLSRPTTA